MKKFVILFVILFFMAFPVLTKAAFVPADHNFGDLFFEGEFLFDINGIYFFCGIGYPLNVLGSIEVLGNDEKLGDLSLNGQKSYPNGEWDGTYFGHWSFSPVESGPTEYEIGIFSDLHRFDPNNLSFILYGFNDVLGIQGELPPIIGTLEGGDFKGSPVPIPTTLLLLGSGLIGIISFKRRIG